MHERSHFTTQHSQSDLGSPAIAVPPALTSLCRLLPASASRHLVRGCSHVSGSTVASLSASGIVIQDAQPVSQHGRCAMNLRSAGYLKR